MNAKSKLRFGDLFAGAGGLSLGFILSHHPTVKYAPLFAIDDDVNALESYRKSMRWLFDNTEDLLPVLPSAFKRDISSLNHHALLRLYGIKKGELDLLVGGPPCQGYSSSNRHGSRSQKTDYNQLSRIYFDKLDAINPKMFLLENVQGVRWTESTPDMSDTSQLPLFGEDTQLTTSVQQYMIDRAIELGYHVWHHVLNAVDFGVPQTRYRFFLFGVRKDLVSVGSVELNSHLTNLREPQVSVEEAIGDLPTLQNGEAWHEKVYQPGANEFVQRMRQYMENGNLNDHFTTKHADYVIERYKAIPEGQNWQAIRAMMTNYKNLDNTHSNIYRRLRKDTPSITISHYRKSMLIHPTQHRGLSFREACRLQSFPDWYQFHGPIDNRQQQLANAVPPLLAAKIAFAIAEFWGKIHQS